MKYFVLVAVIVAVYMLWRWQRSQEQAERSRPPAPPPARPAPPALPQEIVQCAACDMHLPRSEALADARGHHYCCAEHRRQGGS